MVQTYAVAMNKIWKDMSLTFYNEVVYFSTWETCRNSLFQGLVALCMMASYCWNEKELDAHEVGRIGTMAH